MAKQLVHIGVAVSVCGDGRLEHPPGAGIVPGWSNVINIAAAVGGAYKFNENIQPQNGKYGASAFWAKHPEEFAQLQVKPVPLADAMTKLREWLKQFQGRLVACSSALDFWHLLDAFFKTGKDCPFGTVPIDTATLCMQRAGRKRPGPSTGQVQPLQVAQARWDLVTGGRMPVFGAKPAPRMKLKAPVPAFRDLRQTNPPMTAAEMRAAAVAAGGMPRLRTLAQLADGHVLTPQQQNQDRIARLNRQWVATTAAQFNLENQLFAPQVIVEDEDLRWERLEREDAADDRQREQREDNE